MENLKIELSFPYFFSFIFIFALIGQKCPKNGSRFFVHRFTSKLPYNLILIWRIQRRFLFSQDFSSSFSIFVSIKLEETTQKKMQ